MRGKFKIQIPLDFQPGRNRGRFLIARVSFILQHLSIIRVIVNRLEMIGGSEMYGDFYFFFLFYYIERFMSIKLRSGSVPEFCSCFASGSCACGSLSSSASSQVSECA